MYIYICIHIHSPWKHGNSKSLGGDSMLCVGGSNEHYFHGHSRVLFSKLKKVGIHPGCWEKEAERHTEGPFENKKWKKVLQKLFSDEVEAYIKAISLFQIYSFWKWKERKKVNVSQLCPTLCDLKDYTVNGILQARIMEWVAVVFSRGSSASMDPTQGPRIACRFFTNWATRKA